MEDKAALTRASSGNAPLPPAPTKALSPEEDFACYCFPTILQTFWETTTINAGDAEPHTRLRGLRSHQPEFEGVDAHPELSSKAKGSFHVHEEGNIIQFKAASK